jgi:hypothetical protein
MPTSPHQRDLVRYEVVKPRESLGADVVPLPSDRDHDVVVLLHKVTDHVDPHTGLSRYTVSTLPEERGIYFLLRNPGIGYIGAAPKDTLRGRVPASLRDNLLAGADWVLTATSAGAVELTEAEVRQAEALLIERHCQDWHLTNQAWGQRQQLPDGSAQRAERVARALEEAIELRLPPLPNPVTQRARFQRALFRRLGVPLSRETGFRVASAIAGMYWPVSQLEAFARNLTGRSEAGLELRAPAAYKPAWGAYLPTGWPGSKYERSGRTPQNWLDSVALRIADGRTSPPSGVTTRRPGRRPHRLPACRTTGPVEQAPR